MSVSKGLMLTTLSFNNNISSSAATSGPDCHRSKTSFFALHLASSKSDAQATQLLFAIPFLSSKFTTCLRNLLGRGYINAPCCAGRLRFGELRQKGINPNHCHTFLPVAIASKTSNNFCRAWVMVVEFCECRLLLVAKRLRVLTRVQVSTPH